MVRFEILIYLLSPLYDLMTTIFVLLLLKIENRKSHVLSPSPFPATYVIPSISFYMLEGEIVVRVYMYV